MPSLSGAFSGIEKNDSHVEPKMYKEWLLVIIDTFYALIVMPLCPVSTELRIRMTGSASETPTIR